MIFAFHFGQHLAALRHLRNPSFLALVLAPYASISQPHIRCYLPHFCFSPNPSIPLPHSFSSKPLTPSCYQCTIMFNSENFHILPTYFICAFCIDFRTNSDGFLYILLSITTTSTANSMAGTDY